MIAADSTHRTAGRRGIGALGFALAAAVMLVLVPAASAKTEPVGGGKTTLKLSSGAADYLSENQTKIKAAEPAKAKGTKYTLAIKKGELDTKKVKGSLKHDGGLELKGPGGEVELTKFLAKFSKSSKLSAKVEKKSSKLFDLDTEGTKPKVKGSTTKINGVTATLTSKGVGVIEDITDMELEDPEMVFAKVKVAAEAGDVTLSGGDTSLALDAAMKTKLSGAGVSSEPTPPAVLDGEKLSFPVAGGDVGADGGSGTVRLEGGLKLAKGATTLEWSKLRINLADGEITTQAEPARLTVLSFDPEAVTVKSKGKKVTVSKIATTLTEEGATAINDAFGGTAFKADDKFGTFEVAGTTG